MHAERDLAPAGTTSKQRGRIHTLGTGGAPVLRSPLDPGVGNPADAGERSVQGLEPFHQIAAATYDL